MPPDGEPLAPRGTQGALGCLNRAVLNVGSTAVNPHYLEIFMLLPNFRYQKQIHYKHC